MEKLLILISKINTIWPVWQPGAANMNWPPIPPDYILTLLEIAAAGLAVWMLWRTFQPRQEVEVEPIEIERE